MIKASPAATSQAPPSSATRAVPLPRFRAIATAASVPASPSTAITGATASARALPRSDSARASGTSPSPKGKPAPPDAHQSPSAPYASDQAAAA